MDAQTKALAQDYDNLAPDGSEIRHLVRAERSSLAHCTLQSGQVSLAVAHDTVEEIWYFLDGRGEVWRSPCDPEVVEVSAGMSLTIPTGVQFQFRNTGDTPLRFLAASVPPWPGQGEAYRVTDHWQITE